MRKFLISLILVLFLASMMLFTSSCASSKGWDVNDTWRPKQHKRYDLSTPPKPPKRRRR